MTSSPGFRPGVVLAAGLGSRLVSNEPCQQLKPLMPVEGIPLLLRTLHNLEICCDRVVIVLGYGADRIQRDIATLYQGPLQLQYAVNDKYRLANGVSVLAARKYIDGDFILTMADHIMDRKILELARDYILGAGTAALMVDYKIESIYDLDDATKVLEKKGKIISIGKELATYNCIDTGIFVCSSALLESLSRVYEENGDVSLSDGVQELSRDGKMYTVNIMDSFWQDVDTPGTLQYAEKMISLQKEEYLCLKN